MRFLPRCLFALVPMAAAPAGLPVAAGPQRAALAQADHPPAAAPEPPSQGSEAPAALQPATREKGPEDNAPENKAAEARPAAPAAPTEEIAPAATAPAAGEPLYSLDAYRQDAQDLILEFARRAGQPVTMLDQYSALVSVQFRNLPFEKALKRLTRAADLDFIRTEDGCIVGLPIDLRLRFPADNEDPDKFIDATYRCRRIDAKTLVATISKLFESADLKVNEGPAFLTPPVERGAGETYGGALAANALTAAGLEFRTHDIGISGKPALVRRALAMCRKFDRPRKQVRVKVRIMQMSSSLSRSLGIDWMDQLTLSANEIPSASVAAANVAGGNSSALPQGNGLTLGKFSHTAVSLTATLNAMEQSGATKTLSSPTLTLLDGEKAFILSGVKYIYPKITSKDATGQQLFDVMEEKQGVYLQVGVQVGLDDDMVLTLYPQVTSLQSFQNINGALYPIMNSVEEQVTVRALRGEVVVLGGLKQNSLNDSTASVPFLSHIPLLGKLFSSDTNQKTSQELVFFLTPEMVDDPAYPVEMKLSSQPAP